MLKGIGISPGYTAAEAFVYQKRSLSFEEVRVTDTKSEVNRLNLAVRKSKEQIQVLIDTVCKDDKDKQEILSAQIEMLEDDDFAEMVNNSITEQNLNSETAVKNACSYFSKLFESIDDEYLRARMIDLKDATNRVLENLIYGNYTSNLDLKNECIVVAYELTPSETVLLDKDKVLGIVTQKGTKTSHVAIVANSMNIPSVSGINNIFEKIKPNDLVAIDGINGIIYVNPDEETKRNFTLEAKKYNEKKEYLKKYIGEKTQIPDGRAIDLFANIGSIEDAKTARENSAEGIGLFRTEFLYMNRESLPDEDEQFEQYKNVLQLMDNEVVVVRTLDIGGDKHTECINIEDEANPFLGNRAIRLCLERKDIFYTQLRALLRASAYGKMKIMFPMISCHEELASAKQILTDVMKELDEKNTEFDRNIEIGMMIETPASVFMAQHFAKEVDFFSIGTNDLLQYTMAADRNNPKVAYLNSYNNPVIWYMIKHVIDKAHENNIWVGVCGELANSSVNACMLAAMGVDELSVSPNNILPIRHAISTLDKQKQELKLKELMQATNAKKAEKILG